MFALEPILRILRRAVLQATIERKDKHSMTAVSRSCVLFACLLVSVSASAASFCPTVTPVIDGVFSCKEWDGARVIDLDVNLPEGGTAPARLYLMNDSKFLYVALRILREKVDTGTSLAVILDANYDHWITAGDDLMVLTHGDYSGDLVTDGVYYTGGSCPKDALCSGSDTDFGGRNDVAGAVGGDGAWVTYELSKPLMTLDRWDATMQAGVSIGMSFDLRLMAPGGSDWLIGDTEYPPLSAPEDFVDHVIRECTYSRY